MSYPTLPPPVAATPPFAQRSGRPAVVAAAAALLWVMAAAGLIYAIVTLVVVPGVVSDFTGAAGSQDLTDTYTTVIWLGAAIAMALSVIIFALYVVLGLALRRGSNAARIAALAFCVLGAIAGGVSALIVVLEDDGTRVAGSVGAALADAYPGGWISANIGLSVAQIIGYVIVGILLLSAPKAFFMKTVPVAPPAYGYGPFNPGYPPAPSYGPVAPGFIAPQPPPMAPPQATGDDEYWSRPSE